jgi:hypothetical protein
VISYSYDALLEAGYSRRDLDAQNLVRVHPDFRVIALGLPVPPYPGRTLDPPLRSRFQARNVRSPSPGTQLEALVNISPTVPIPVLERLVGIREAVNVIEATTQATGSSGQQRMPHFNYLSTVLKCSTSFLTRASDTPSGESFLSFQKFSASRRHQTAAR